jgi:hypothetical protein
VPHTIHCGYTRHSAAASAVQRRRVRRRQVRRRQVRRRRTSQERGASLVAMSVRILDVVVVLEAEREREGDLIHLPERGLGVRSPGDLVGRTHEIRREHQPGRSQWTGGPGVRACAYVSYFARCSALALSHPFCRAGPDRAGPASSSRSTIACGDRADPRGGRTDREDPCRPDPDEAGPPGQGPGGRVRLRVRTRGAGRGLTRRLTLGG